MLRLFRLGTRIKKLHSEAGKQSFSSLSMSWIGRYPQFMLLIMVMATAAVVYYPFLFQNQIFMYSDIGSDTQNVYYPFFISLFRKLTSGDFSMMDFSHGLGTSLLSRPADSASLFTYLQFLLGAGGIKYALVYVHIFKIVLSALICYCFLGCFNFSKVSKIMVSYAYAFNGFTILWGQHYFFAAASLYIILVLLGVEKTISSKKGIPLLCIGTFLVMLNTYYLAYMVLMIAAVYALFRLAFSYSFKQLKKVAKKIGLLFVAVFIGAMMSACVFLPAVYLLLGTSSRVSDDTSILGKIVYYFTEGLFDQDTLQAIVSRFYSNNLMGTTDYSGPWNYYEMPQWFFTSFLVFFALVLMSELLLNKGERIKNKLLKLLALCLMVSLAFQPFLSVVLNGFVTHFFRYTFVVMPVLALCAAYVLDRIIGRKLVFAVPQLLICSLLSVAIMMVSTLSTDSNSEVGKRIGYLTLMLMVAMSVLVLVFQKANMSRRGRTVAVVCMLCIFALNVTAESYVTTNARIPVCKTTDRIYQTTGNDDVHAALKYIEEHDTSFHRTEKMFHDISFLNDSMLEGYYGVSVYNSTVNTGIIEFVNQCAPEMKVLPADGYYDFRPIYSQINKVSLLGVKYLLSQQYITDIPAYTYIATFGSVHLYENTQTEGIAQFFTDAISYEEFAALDAGEKDRILGSTLILNGENVRNFRTHGEENALCDFQKPDNSSHIYGTVQAQSDGWLFLSVPNEEGWTAWVDGEEATILEADYAFCAIELSAGTHVVELRYQTPLLKEGIAISVIGMLLFAALCVYLFLANRKIRH